MQESNRIEFKRELTDTLEKEVIAFLNYRDGGVTYIGITPVAFTVSLQILFGWCCLMRRGSIMPVTKLADKHKGSRLQAQGVTS